MKVKVLSLSIALVAAAVVARAEDLAAKGKEIVEAKKCAMCHGADNSKKPMKVEGKTDEWLGKFFDGEEAGPGGKMHTGTKGKLTAEEKAAVIAYVKTLK